MPEPVYVIVFDQLDPSFDPVAIRDVMRGEPRISHWWNHIPNCFLVSTDLDAGSLTACLKRHTGEVGFVVMQADSANCEGYLPTRSWRWIRRREQEQLEETA